MAVKESTSEKLCVVCKVLLSIRWFREYRGDPMQMIIGPGSQNQMTTFVETYCKQCGLLYVNGGGIDPQEQHRVSDFDTMVAMLERQQSQRHKREFVVLPDDDKSFRVIVVTCFYGRPVHYYFDKPELQLSNIITYVEKPA